MSPNVSKFLWVHFLLIGYATVYAQNNAEVAYFNYVTVPKSDFKEGTGTASLNSAEFNLVTPMIHLTKKTKLNTILYYRWSGYDFNEANLESLNIPEQFHEVKVTFLMRHTFNANWELLFVPRINVRSDFEASIGKKDLFPALSAIGMRTSQNNPKRKCGFGLNYNNDFGKNSIIPILAFTYTSEKMRFSTYFPNNASIVFFSKKKMEYGFAYVADPTLVHVSTNNSIEYIRTLNFYVHPTFACKVTSNVWLTLKAGYVLRRNFDLYTSNFESPSADFENKLKASAFVQVGLSLRSKQ